MHVLSSADTLFQISKLTFFKKIFQECYQSVNQFASKSGPTSMPGLIRVQTDSVAKVISRLHLLAK